MLGFLVDDFFFPEKIAVLYKKAGVLHGSIKSIVGVETERWCQFVASFPFTLRNLRTLRTGSKLEFTRRKKTSAANVQIDPFWTRTNLTGSFYCVLFQSRVRSKQISDFSIDLIHRDSLLSPFYNRSIISSELLRRSVIRSLNRVNLLSSFDEKDLVSTITSHDGDYLMKIYIGSPLVKILASVDTASDLIWIQCTPCYHCYNQDEPIFDPKNSSSYKTLCYDTKFCQALNKKKRGNSDECMYHASYEEGSYSAGILSNETFNIDSTSDGVVSFPELAFGCGHQNYGDFNSRVQGVVGLGRGLLSLVSQLKTQIDHTFSYCLLPRKTTNASKLKFGLGAKIHGTRVVSTPIVDKDPPNYYHLTLESISIGEDTTKTRQSPGNIIIDSGTTLTILHSSLYNDLEEIIRRVIGINPEADVSKKFSLCYGTRSIAHIKLPTMVFHFSGADLHLPTINTFIRFSDLVCMLIVPDNKTSIFGNMAQVNFQVEYDLLERKVSFARRNWKEDLPTSPYMGHDNCTLDSHALELTLVPPNLAEPAATARDLV
ncbi:aspartic proteinase CDR1-like [Tripterygium wilfordii]|uniref:aspartic proteinase CDR1-like n=1 Tax=Tripterygium wilfordii TaxID=458696 RepID=UPI0018F84667|nr:aspartic proteinase CDR1-like [Tripterygium wilfordii]